MGLWRRISQQLSEPSGPLGRLTAALMNRGNRAMNEGAIERLEPGPGDRVLDLGFGGGLTLVPLLDRGAQVTGVDRATDMISAARRRHGQAVKDGRLALAEGDVMALPFADAAFDAVLTVNTVYFWEDLPGALAEIARVTSSGGRLVIGIRDEAAMRNLDRAIFTVRSPGEIAAALAAAGFTDVRVDTPPEQALHYIVGIREASA